MRYVIIPLLIILYMWWTVNVVRDLISSIKIYRSIKRRVHKYYEGCALDYTEQSTDVWLIIHIFAAVIVLLILSIIYW